MTVTAREAADRRAEAAERADGGTREARTAAPAGVTVRRAAPTPASLRSAEVTRDGKSYLRLTGAASVYERRYEMFDYYGPYDEIISESAGALSLAREPDVVYLLNHGGIPFARTVSGTLDLSEPGGELHSEAYLNPKRQDVQDLVASVEDGSSTEMSFAFRILDGRWSPDFTEYRVNEYDLDRGDVSVVTFGANPHTSVSARAARFAVANDFVRAARGLAEDERTLLLEALSPVEEPLSRERLGPSRFVVGDQIARDLRHLRAHIAEGSAIDSTARATIAGLIDDVLAGGPRLGGDGPLGVLRGVQEAPNADTASTFAPADVAFLSRALDAARQLN